MRYRRACKGCGSFVTYSDAEEYVICPECGRKVWNTHFYEIELPEDEIQELYTHKQPKVVNKKKSKAKDFFNKIKNDKPLFISLIVTVSIILIMSIVLPVSLNSFNDNSNVYSNNAGSTSKVEQVSQVTTSYYYNSQLISSSEESESSSKRTMPSNSSFFKDCNSAKGKFFAGWYDNSSLTGGAITSYKPNKDQRFYAKMLTAEEVSRDYLSTSGTININDYRFFNTAGTMENGKLCIMDNNLTDAMTIHIKIDLEEKWGKAYEVTNITMLDDLTMQYIYPDTVMYAYEFRFSTEYEYLSRTLPGSIRINNAYMTNLVYYYDQRAVQSIDLESMGKMLSAALDCILPMPYNFEETLGYTFIN